MSLYVGSVDATCASLADRVQAQKSIPYVLYDGRFANTPETSRERAAAGVWRHLRDVSVPAWMADCQQAADALTDRRTATA